MRYLFVIQLLCWAFVVPAQTPSWTLVSGLPAQQISSLFVRDNHIYAAGVDRIYHSADGGDHWDTSALIVAGLDYINDVVEIDGVWYVATTVDGVFASTDAGQSWQAINAGLSGLGALNPSMLAHRDNYLYVSTNGAGVFRRPLNGSNPTWAAFNTQLPWDNVVSIVNIDGQLLAGAGANATVARNLPGTTTWIETPFDQFNGEISMFYNAVKVGNAIVAVGSQGVYRSVDAGATWSGFNPGLGLAGLGDLAASGSTVYALLTKVNGLSSLGYSTDAGLNWQAFEPTPGHQTWSLALAGNRLFAGRIDGLWYLDLPTSGLPHQPAAGLAVRTVAPNPAREQTELRIELDVAADLSLRLYSLRGEVAVTREYGRLPAGEHRLDLALQTLPPGVYVYRLESGRGSASGRIVVAR